MDGSVQWDKGQGEANRSRRQDGGSEGLGGGAGRSRWELKHGASFECKGAEGEDAVGD